MPQLDFGDHTLAFVKAWRFEWLKQIKASKTTLMPAISPNQSIGLATRLKKGWVSSSTAPKVEMAKKSTAAESNEKQSRSERTKRRVIAP